MQTQNYVIFRLIPGKYYREGIWPKTTMFTIRDATGAQLITGNHWGDDYLVVHNRDEVELVKDCLDEARMPYEKVESLPPHLTCQLI